MQRKPLATFAMFLAIPLSICAFLNVGCHDDSPVPESAVAESQTALPVPRSPDGAEDTDAVTRLVEDPTDLGESAFDAAIVRQGGSAVYDGGRIITFVDLVTDYIDTTHLHSTLSLREGSFLGPTNGLGQDRHLTVGCGLLGRYTHIQGLSIKPLLSEDPRIGHYYQVSYRVFPTAADGIDWARDLTWIAHETANGWVASIAHTARFYVRVRQVDELKIILSGAEETVELFFDLDGFWHTPLQPNIDHCGSYY